MISVMSNLEQDMAVKEESATSNYISNMKLPEKVKATRLQPLGPDCIISSKEVTDPAVLKTVQYYWCVSRDTGCVECVVKISKSNKTVTASDPKCVITKKHRRFEAYCCMICRFNFVTIVQALSHLKAIHRPNNKILIQDKDVFQNLDKAMEVPAVPLPWHVAKKLVEQGKSLEEVNPPPTYVIPPGSFTSSTITNTVATHPCYDNTVPNQASSLSDDMTADNSTTNIKESFIVDSPMACIIAALTEKFEKKVGQLKFEEDCSKLNATFTDGTSVIAKIPDLSYANVTTPDIPTIDDIDEPLKFFVDENFSQNGDGSGIETVTLLSNRPQYARKLFSDTILAAAPEGEKPSDPNNNQEIPKKPEDVNQVISVAEESDTEVVKPHKPVKKSVRFSVGHPDSDDEHDASPEVPDDEAGGLSFKDVPTIHVSNPLGEPVKDKEDNGLQTVISDLMSTASKGRIIAPTSPVPSTSPSMSASIPQVGSSPALFSMALPAATTGSLTRVQSWSPSVAPSPFSVASMRRPYTARGFTYAEKIQYMKQQNDYDAEFVSKHIREKDSKSKSHDEKANSDGEERMTLRKRRKDRRYSEEEFREAEDSDPQETALAENAALAAAYTSLIQRGLFNSNIFPSEYYGSGEWASAALETLKNLHPLLKGQEESPPKQQPAADASSRMPEAANPNASRSFVDTKDSFSDDNVSMVKRSVRTKPYQPRKRAKSGNESSSSTDDPGSPPKRRKNRNHAKAQALSTPIHSDSRLPSGVTLHSATLGSDSFVKSDSWMGQAPRIQSVVEKLPSQAIKVPLSPLLSDLEKDHIQQHHHTRHLKTEPSPTLTVSKIRSLNEPPVKHLSVSNLSSRNMGAKCPSDPNLSSSSSGKRSSQSPRQSTTRMSTGKALKQSYIPYQERSTSNLLHANDQLELLDDVTLSDYDANKLIVTRLKSNDPDAEKQMTVLTRMPEIFRNCLESRVKIRLIQKVYSCKVCGFSVDITQGGANSQGGGSPLEILETHVMEHSLKDLYATKL